MTPCASSAAAPTEFHSLSPPCVHSAETPGPLIDQPGALAAGNSRYEGLSSGSCREVSERPRMFSVSYHRYSAADGGTRGRGDTETVSLRSICGLAARSTAPTERRQQMPSA